MSVDADDDGKLRPSWDALEAEAERLAKRWHNRGIEAVYGIPQGGTPVAVMVADSLGAEVLLREPERGNHVLIVDDLVDSGRTGERWLGWSFDALYRKPHSPESLAGEATEVEGWIVFPWERGEAGPEDAVTRLLDYIGDDPSREGLADTPARVVRALAEMTCGYRMDAGEALGTVFNETSDEMVVLSGIRLASMCEHHLLPFTGTVTIGYVPDGQVVGLSKMARIVEVYGRRLQVQERLTGQLADAMWEYVRPLGVGVVVKATHQCMAVRGVNEPHGVMTTSAMRGIFQHSPATRDEFLRLANGHE